jgi:pimeloyl-ACP methyl ester carboxylesterase
MQIVVNGLLIHYELSGKGRLVLLLHGWADSAKGLASLQTELSKKYRVLTVDLPGFGASQIPKDSWNLDDYAQFLEATLNKLTLPQPYAIVGHSNGGAIAIRALGLDILQPEKLVLLAASGVRNTQKLRKVSLKVLAKTGNVATVWLPRKNRQALRRRLYQVAGSDMLVVPELEATYKRTVGQDVQADAAKIRVPALLIYASKDEAAPVVYGERYHQLIPNSRLEIIKDAGHFMYLDEPQRVFKLIEEFLA